MKAQNMLRKSHFGGSISSLFCDLVTLVGHFLVLLPCAGKASGDVASGIITALVGETVTLPCSVPSKEVPTVEWSKEGLSPSNIVFLYRDGCETVGAKNPAFQYRTNLIMKELQNGNFSLIISNLQLSDVGTYQCKIVQGTQPELVASLHLVVAVLKPNLTVVSNDGYKITLNCEVECCVPEPEITFLDHQGNEITTEKQQREPGRGKCFSNRRVTLQTSTRRVTCRVHQPGFNRTRSADIHILDNHGSFVKSTTVTVVVTLVVTFGICGLAFFMYKKLGCKGRAQKPAVSEQSLDQDPTCKKQTDDVGKPEKQMKDPANPNPTQENKEDEIQQPSEKPQDRARVFLKLDSGSSADKATLGYRFCQSSSRAAKVSTSDQNDLVKTKDPKQAATSHNPSPRETQPPAETQLNPSHIKRLPSMSFKGVSAANLSEESEPLID